MVTAYLISLCCGLSIVRKTKRLNFPRVEKDFLIFLYQYFEAQFPFSCVEFESSFVTIYLEAEKFRSLLVFIYFVQIPRREQIKGTPTES